MPSFLEEFKLLFIRIAIVSGAIRHNHSLITVEACVIQGLPDDTGEVRA